MTPQPQHCEHECVCTMYIGGKDWLNNGAPCNHGCNPSHDTRSRPAPSSPEKDVLDLLKKRVTWGKEINRNQLFDYRMIGKMIEEAEQRVESLRTEAQK